MIAIDGSKGEGGGQILRTALALSLLTGASFSIEKIRAGRSKPGLMRPHLACVRAAATIGDAEVDGAEIGARMLTFRPGRVRAGNYRFDTGGAGSTTLVWQTVLMPLLSADAPSSVELVGGTHNPMAPPFEFVRDVFAAQLQKLGVQLDLTLERHGFYPAGGGRWRCAIEPWTERLPLTLLERGTSVRREARALVAQLAGSIAVRELDTLCHELEWDRAVGKPEMVRDSAGPGNVLQARLEHEHVREIVSGFGERGLSAERVASAVARETKRYLASDAPVGEHLADQLLMPLVLGAGGTFRTLAPTPHCLTQIEMLRLFLDVSIEAREESRAVWRITCPPAMPARRRAQVFST